MAGIVLNVEKREKTGTGGARATRKSGLIPGVLYGGARGAISVTERAAYIGRIRNLSRAVATAYVESREALGYPMLPAAQRRAAA